MMGWRLRLRRARYAWHRANLRTVVAVTLTALYLETILILLVWRFDEFTNLSLNSLGDFFAGTFAPLAFAWLIVGYLQQGDELQQNSKALLMQAKELQHSVTQQKELVAVAKLEYEAMRDANQIERERRVEEQERLRKEAQPRFDLRTAGGRGGQEGYRWTFGVTNFGSDCHAVTLWMDEVAGLALLPPLPEGIFVKGQSATCVVQVEGGDTKKTILHIAYRDVLDVDYKVDFLVSASINGCDFRSLR